MGRRKTTTIEKPGTRVHERASSHAAGKLRARGHERGGALVMVLILSALLFAVAVSLAFVGDVELRTSKNYLDGVTALTHTDTAVNEVRWRLELTQGAGAPPLGSRITVNNLTSYDASLTYDPQGVLANAVDDDADGTVDEPDELNLTRDWTVRILHTPSALHPGSPWEVTDTDIAAGPPWGSKLVVPTIQAMSSPYLYSDDTASSSDVLTVRFKLDTDTPLGDSEGDGAEIVFHEIATTLNGIEDMNTLSALGGNGNPADDSPYNITWTGGGVTYAAVGAPVLLVEATGRVVRAGRTVTRKRIVAELLPTRAKLFDKALCASNSLVVHEDVDSYRSSEGPYGTGPIYENASVGSNDDLRVSTAYIHGSMEAGGEITGGGHSDVSGDVSCGGLFDGDYTIAGTLQSNLNPDPAPCEFPLDMPTLIAQAQASNENANILPDGVHGYWEGTNTIDTSKDLYPSGGTELKVAADRSIILTGGTYFFESIRLGSGASIQVGLDTDGDGIVDTPPTSPVKIYSTGSIDIAGKGSVNGFGTPANLQFYIWSTVDASFSGGDQFRGFIYHPLGQVRMTGGAAVCGAVYAKDIHSSQPFHYDESLDMGDGPVDVRVLAWREIR